MHSKPSLSHIQLFLPATIAVNNNVNGDTLLSVGSYIECVKKAVVLNSYGSIKEPPSGTLISSALFEISY